MLSQKGDDLQREVVNVRTALRSQTLFTFAFLDSNIFT